MALIESRQIHGFGVRREIAPSIHDFLSASPVYLSEVPGDNDGGSDH
jgi:hypothetical protein